MGNTKIFNMVVLGAYMKMRPIVKIENVIKGLKKSLPERYHSMIPLNESAINKGMENIISA
jgi:2-oxoglutarate ferredoxin oxidoreductase subunit gamma